MRDEPAFKIKNANFPLLILHLGTCDPARLTEALEERLAMTPDFFADTPIVLGLSSIEDADSGPDFPALLAFMRSHRMPVAGVQGGSARQREEAVAAGLGVIPESPVRAPAAAPAEPAPEPVCAEPVPESPPEVATEAPADEPPELRDVVSVAETRTLVIDRPVRTGQRIYAEGAHLVVLGIVNPGAELIADGDIHVYAPLRGKAIAGARGDTTARIYVQRMEAELLSIAGCFQVFEDGLPEHVRGKPAHVHLDGSRLVFQALGN